MSMIKYPWRWTFSWKIEFLLTCLTGKKSSSANQLDIPLIMWITTRENLSLRKANPTCWATDANWNIEILHLSSLAIHLPRQRIQIVLPWLLECADLSVVLLVERSKVRVSCFLSFFLYIMPDPLSSIIGRCTLYTPGCRMKAYK